MRFQSQIRRRLRRKQQLFHRPGLPRFRIPADFFRRKTVEHQIVSRMHRDQLPLQMGGKFSQLQTVLGQGAEHFIAIGLAFRGALQIEQAAIP